jgi:SAM-dependent methyltransferase
MQESEYHNLAKMERTHWWYAGMNALAAQWVRQLPSVGAARMRILDAGCGTGGALGWLVKLGAPCGIDLHPLPLRLARATRVAPVAMGDVQALPFATGCFDLVTCFDVLYHWNVTWDSQALRELTRVLRPGGWLLLRVPAHNWLRGAHDRTVHTRHRYSRAEVLAKLRGAGLQPVRVTYANALLFLPAVLWRMFTRNRPATVASDVRVVPKPLNAFLTAILNLEARWLRRFNLPFGLSVMALARKEVA